MMADCHRVIAVLTAENGYREGYGNGWTNENKYSKELPGFGWSDFQAWCATFQMWGFWKTGMLKSLSVVSAGVWYLYQAGLQAGRFTEYPTLGALGIISENTHVFMVTGWDDTYVYTVEGNTNDNGSANGNGVYLRKRLRTSPSITGYVIPDFPDGVIISADPKWNNPAGNGKVTTTDPTPTPVQEDELSAQDVTDIKNGLNYLARMVQTGQRFNNDATKYMDKQPFTYLEVINNNVAAVSTQVQALTAAIAAVTTDPNLDEAAISRIFDEALTKAATTGLTARVTLEPTQSS